MSEENQLQHRMEVLEQEKTQFQQRVEVLEDQMRQLLPVETQRDAVNLHTESKQMDQDELTRTELDIEERVRQLEQELKEKENELDDERKLRQRLENELNKKENKLNDERKLRLRLEDELKKKQNELDNHKKQQLSSQELEKKELAQKLNVPYHIILDVFETISTEKEEDLLAAVQRGDTLKVRVLLEIGAYIETTTTSSILNRTPLHLAAAECHVQIVTVLLNCGANVHAKDSGKRTPLHLAAQKGEYEICKLLVAAGASVDALNSAKQSPFAMAVESNHFALCKFFIDSKCNVNVVNLRHVDSPIHKAMMRDQLPLVKLLLQSGAGTGDCSWCKESGDIVITRN